MPEPPRPPELEVDLTFPDGTLVTTDRPYRVLVISDLAGSAGPDELGSLAGVLEITAGTFDSILSAATPPIRMTMADPLSASGRMVEVELKLNSMRTLDPKELVERLPATRALAMARSMIVDRFHGRLNAAELLHGISSLPTGELGGSWLIEQLNDSSNHQRHASPQSGTSIEALLDQVDLGDEPPRGSAGGTNARSKPKDAAQAVGAVAGTCGALSAEESSTLRLALTELDRRISAWLTAVMHAPMVLQLQAAWGALAWLAENVDFRRGIRISLLHSTKDEVVSRLIEQVIDPVFDGGADAPDVLVADYAFGNTATDIQTLDELAQHAASLPAVILAGIGPGFFGVKHGWQIPTLPPLVNLLDQWQYAKWKTLRTKPYASNLGLVFGRFLQREPFGPPTDSVGEFEFVYREPCSAELQLPWISGAVAAACTLARSQAETGWPTAMAGQVGGRIEGLPRLQVPGKVEKWIGPTDAPIPQPRVDEMGMAGINVLSAVPGRDAAVVQNGMTVARPKRNDPNSLLEVSLPYQLFAQRLSALLLALRASLLNQPGEEVVSQVRAHLSAWLGLAGEASAEHVAVQVRPLEGHKASLQLAVTVTPPPNVLPGAIPVVLGYTLDGGSNPSS